MARSTHAGIWIVAGLALSSCGVPQAAMDAVGEESLDTAEVLASASAAPAPQAKPLDLGIDPSAVIISGEGDAETLNRIGWEGTELPVGDYTAHLQCRGTQDVTFTYHPIDGGGTLQNFACGAPQRIKVSVPAAGYFMGFNVRADATEGIEYIFAVTAVDYPGS
ncbi:hypothetical protein [Arthrobacter sp. CAN_A1]|uniref:hypothetical protein n=1 Tax=Arthrobacter sp. CAN_A1 TaxID=2787717 RepID=UPI0018C98FB1